MQRFHRCHNNKKTMQYINSFTLHQQVDKPNEDKTTITVDAYSAMLIGDEPLITIKKEQ